MNIFEHITLWQALFTALPQKPPFVSFILVFILSLRKTNLFILAALFFSNGRHLIRFLTKSLAVVARRYIREHANISIFDPLMQAFSQGILNPKVYEFDYSLGADGGFN